MPQLVKGGKYVFGWSRVRDNGEISIPPEALFEYGFINDQKACLIPGSKRSRGFGLSSKRLLKRTIIAKEIEIKSKKFSWVELNGGRNFIIPGHLLKIFGTKLNDQLLVVRGSGIALGFIAQGPIYEEARRHNKILYY